MAGRTNGAERGLRLAADHRIDRGGQSAGGARITARGRDVLARYRAMEEKAAGAIDRDLAEFAKLMKDDADRTA